MKTIIFYLLFIQLSLCSLSGQNKCKELRDDFFMYDFTPLFCDAHDGHPIDNYYMINDSVFFRDKVFTGEVKFQLYRTLEITNDIIQHPNYIATVKGIFINSKKNGLWRKYIWAIGGDRLLIEESYNNGLLHGVRRIFDISGKEIDRTIFIEGTGRYREYYTGTNQNLMEGLLLHGKRNGTWLHYSKKGNCQKIENYKNGILHGEYKVFTDNNELTLYETIFKDGTGYYKSYNDVGELTEEGMVENGFRIGKWIENFYYIDKYDDRRKHTQLLSTYTKESPINKINDNLIDVFFINEKPFYIKALERK